MASPNQVTNNKTNALEILTIVLIWLLAISLVVILVGKIRFALNT